MGQPIAARCARSWCVRPLTGHSVRRVRWGQPPPPPDTTGGGDRDEKRNAALLLPLLPLRPPPPRRQKPPKLREPSPAPAGPRVPASQATAGVTGAAPLGALLGPDAATATAQDVSAGFPPVRTACQGPVPDGWRPRGRSTSPAGERHTWRSSQHNKGAAEDPRGDGEAKGWRRSQGAAEKPRGGGHTRERSTP